MTVITTIIKSGEWVKIKNKKLLNVAREMSVFQTEVDKSKANHSGRSAVFHKVKENES